MGSAPRAQILVTVGKARTAYIMPALYTHYHHLPSALIKPNEPSRVGQYKGVNNYTYMKPIDYIGLYIIVIASGIVATNWLYRLDF
jgi:hypothetical protein